jgi:RNA polymerase primary sigma factor
MGKFEQSESLVRYFKSIQGLNPLTKDEELELGRKAKAGDRAAMDKLIKHNLKIVVTIANKNIGRGIHIDDLIQQGNLGLYEAALKFDPEVGVRFATFAGTRILKSINSLIDTCGRTVRIPVNQEYQRYLAKKRGEDVEDLSKVELDRLVGDSERSVSDSGIISVGASVYEEFETRDLKVKVTKALSHLKDRDREIVKKFYGLDYGVEMSSSDIAEEFGLTQIRVCQIVKAAKDKLKQYV